MPSGQQAAARQRETRMPVGSTQRSEGEIQAGSRPVSDSHVMPDSAREMAVHIRSVAVPNTAATCSPRATGAARRGATFPAHPGVPDSLTASSPQG